MRAEPLLTITFVLAVIVWLLVCVARQLDFYDKQEFAEVNVIARHQFLRVVMADVMPINTRCAPCAEIPDDQTPALVSEPKLAMRDCGIRQYNISEFPSANDQ